MRRQLWIEYPGTYYHIMSHGTGELWRNKSSDDLIKRLNKIDEV